MRGLIFLASSLPTPSCVPSVNMSGRCDSTACWLSCVSLSWDSWYEVLVRPAPHTIVNSQRMWAMDDDDYRGWFFFPQASSWWLNLENFYYLFLFYFIILLNRKFLQKTSNGVLHHHEQDSGKCRCRSTLPGKWEIIRSSFSLPYRDVISWIRWTM